MAQRLGMSKAIPREIIGSGINDKHSLPLGLDVVLFVLLLPSPQTCSPGNCEENRTTVYLATMFLPKLLHDVSSRPFLPERPHDAVSRIPQPVFTRQAQPALVGAGVDGACPVRHRAGFSCCSHINQITLP